MTAADFFYVSAGIGIWVEVAFVVVAAVQIMTLVWEIKRGLKQAGEDLQKVKEGIKVGAATFVGNLLSSKRR